MLLALLEAGTVNHMPVKEGWCWWYRKYAPGNTMLDGLEGEAREARRGLARIRYRRGSGESKRNKAESEVV